MSRSDTKAPEPMDPGARETDGPAPEHVNSERTAYALKTLVSEVLELFPETPHEFSERNGRNTALAVTFDVTPLDLDERDKFASLLSLAKADDRVEEVIVDEEGLVCVRLVNSHRTADIRDPFDLPAIWADMGEDERPVVAPQTVPVTEEPEPVDESEVEDLLSVTDEHLLLDQESDK